MPRPLAVLTEEECNEIVERVCSGETLTGVCKSMNIPFPRMWRYRKRNKKFDDALLQAQQEQSRTMLSDAVDIIDDAVSGLNGIDDPRKSSALASIARYRAEMRIKVASLMNPTYRSLTGPNGGPIKVEVTKYTDQDLKKSD